MAENWKKAALRKQLNFKSKQELKTCGTFKGMPYEHILSDTDAAAGAQFYCHNNPPEWAGLQAWAKEDKGKRVNFIGTGLKNMLRSEHIPYNLFYPLEKLRKNNPALLISFLHSLVDHQLTIDEVVRIKVEFAGDVHKNLLLDDNTSFDVYIEYTKDDELCGIGIEVKYTELSYPYGTKEEGNLKDLSSIYNLLANQSGNFVSNAHEALRKKDLKQLWRNHLLGLKLVEKELLKTFHSIHLFPASNMYQARAAQNYNQQLTEKGKQLFLPITFEKFIETAEALLQSEEEMEWVKYLWDRY